MISVLRDPKCSHSTWVLGSKNVLGVKSTVPHYVSFIFSVKRIQLRLPSILFHLSNIFSSVKMGLMDFPQWWSEDAINF